jgi:hypothetical protein
MHNKKCQTNRHFMNKERKYLKDKIDELERIAKTRTLETYIKEYSTSRWVSNLEVT